MQFDWDEGNRHKSVTKHGISNAEAESCFYTEDEITFESLKQSEGDIRYIRISYGSSERLIANVFVIRDRKIRIISSRPANGKESKKYYQGYPKG
jgi:uncharacterized DUF497 family protein